MLLQNYAGAIFTAQEVFMFCLVAFLIIGSLIWDVILFC